MKPLINKQSSFNPSQSTNYHDKMTYLASKKAQQVLKSNQPLQLVKPKIEDSQQQLSPLVSLLIHIFISLVKGKVSVNQDSSKQQISDKLGFSLMGNILSQHIKLPLLRLIANIIQKKLYKSTNHHDQQQISYSVIFKNCLLSVFLSIVSQNSSLIGMDRIVNFHKHLMAENYILYVPIYLYFMYGGGLFTIEKKIFKNSFTKLISNLSYVLTKEETVITRNVEEIKKNKHQAQILSQSLNIVCSATNKDFVNEIADKLCLLIFNQRDYIRKEEFCQAVFAIPQEDKSKEYLLFYLHLLRVQMQVVQSSKVTLRSNSESNAEQEKVEKQSSTFYATQMQKILKKCPYNGDKKCECKKCQCVRRNRESAKLSQEKKRNAVQQIQPMRERIVYLQAQNKQLMEENVILKELLSTTLKNNPQFKSMLMGTIEPMSKIIRDN